MVDEFSKEKPQFDLFGNLIEPLRDRRGRPSFKKTKENQDFVAVRAAAGWTQENIAEALGCDLKTLRKYFSPELHSGSLIVEGVQLDVLMRRARQGHVPSIKELGAIIGKGRLSRHPAPQPKKEGRSEPLGKKAQRAEDAKKPSGTWGEVLAPSGDVH